MVEPVLTVPSDEVCFIAIKARALDAHDVETDPDSGSDPSADGMIEVLPTLGFS